MSDEEKVAMMREFVKSLESNDFEKIISLCTDDFVFEMPQGTFRGKEDFKRCLDWLGDMIKNFKITETGNGIMVQGDKAFYEHIFSGIMEGEKAEFLAFCAYEFSDAKISKIRTLYDRLSIAEQASSKWLEKKIVNSIVSQMQKGL